MLRVGRTGKINSWLAKGDRWLPAVFFLFVLGLYLTMMASMYFVDELDVFYGGYNVAKGGDVYKVYATQHMPFSYYLAAPAALLGARTIFQFRLYFYIILSGLWTGMYIRYRKHFPRPALILMPLLYIVQLRMHNMATTMISDHWQGLGLVLVLLELLRYADTKKITAGMSCMVSLGIVLSFGTTFISAYPLLMVFLGVAAMQAVQAVKKERKLPEMLREDGRLALICLCPFLLLALWYGVSGNLGNAVGGAYTLNVSIYSKYLGGYGSSPGGTFFAVFPNWIHYQAKGWNWLQSGDWRWALQIWLQTAALLVLCVSLWLEKKRTAAAVFLLATLMVGVRAFDGFHGAAYMAVTCIPMALCLDGALSFFLEKRSWRRAIPAAAALALAAALIFPEIGMIKTWINVPWLLQDRQYPESNRDLLGILAEPGEQIHTDDISYSGQTIMRNNLRLDEGSIGAGCPWFYEFYGEREMQKLRENQPRILLYEPEAEIWGYKMEDYAPDLTAYIESHYTPLGLNICIRNEDYAAAVEKLRQAGYGAKMIGPDYDGDYELGPLLEAGRIYEQSFTAADRNLTAVQLRVATYLGRNRAGIRTELVDAETGEVLAESTLGQQELWDNAYSRFAMKAETEPGKTYIVRAELDGDLPEGKDSRMNFYTDPNGRNSALLDGEKQPFDWVLKVEYDPET